MLDQAAAIGTKRPVEWRQADAMQLPFADGDVRRRRVPVRRHVLPRQGEGVFGGASRAQAGRRLHLQRVGSDRGERIRRHRDDGARVPVSRGPAALPGPHAPRLLRPSRPSSAIWQAAASLRQPQISTVAARSRAESPGSRRSRTARGRRCATRSRRATPRGSAKQPTSRRKRSPGGSGAGPWTARSRRTLSPSKADRRESLL